MLLEVKGLGFSLEQKPALQNITFQIPAPQITSILGTNGAGKSTLLQAIAGLLDPKEGEILFQGEKVWGPAYRLVPGHPKIALVKQDNRLLPMHTVRDNLRYVLRAYEENYQKEKIEELAHLVGIGAYLDRVVKYLSGGEQQRTAIAAALASHPGLLLMDEPFSQTDVYVKQELKQYLQEIVRQLEIAIVIVSHHPEEALALSDEIFILDQGQLIESGKGSTLYYHPQQETTARLTGVCNWLPKQDFPELAHLHPLGENWLLRPDQIKLVEERETLTGYIDKIEFAGFYRIYHLRLASSGHSLVAFQLGATPPFHVGQQVGLSFCQA